MPNQGRTPLHRAAAFGTEETIQILLDAGAKLTPRIWAEIHRSVGPAGTYALMPFLEALLWEFEFIRRGALCGSVLQGEPY